MWTSNSDRVAWYAILAAITGLLLWIAVVGGMWTGETDDANAAPTPWPAISLGR